MAAGMATGQAWFKVPSAIKFNLTGKPAKWASGKDIILHIIGMNVSYIHLLRNKHNYLYEKMGKMKGENA